MGTMVALPKRETKLSLPGFAIRQLRYLGSVTVGGRTKKYLSAGIPGLTDDERRQVESKITDIERELQPTTHDEDIKLALLAEMMIATASAKLSEKQVEIKSAIYMEVLRDVPAWAMRRALRKWYAGKIAGVAEDQFNWAPSSALLLRACDDELREHREALADLKLLLDVKHIDETIAELESPAKSNQQLRTL